jgi:hypothetical protein
VEIALARRDVGDSAPLQPMVEDFTTDEDGAC